VKWLYAVHLGLIKETRLTIDADNEDLVITPKNVILSVSFCLLARDVALLLTSRQRMSRIKTKMNAKKI
jgi:hypothetical protein